MDKIVKVSYFCLGLGATSPLIALVVGGRVLSLMSISLIFVIFHLLLSPKIKYKKRRGLSQLFLGWMIISIISTIFGFLYFYNIDSRYSFVTISFLPKILLYLFLFYLLKINTYSYIKSTHILTGIKYGVGLNLLWSIADAIMYYTTRYSLTNMVFNNYIQATDMHYGIASIIDGITIRSVGLNNDPANIGFFDVIGAVYAVITKRKWIIIISVLASLACVSFVGLLGIGLALVLNWIFTMQVDNSQKNKIRIKYHTVISSIIIFVISGIWFTTTNVEIVSQFRDAIVLRAESKMSGDHSGVTRKLFITKFPNSLTVLPTSLIIGTGYYTGIYAYYKEGVTYSHEEPTEMENTYIDNFFSFGLIGFLFFIGFFVKMCSDARKLMSYNQNLSPLEIIYSLGTAALISFASYHYTLYSVIILTSISAIIVIDKDKVRVIQKKKVIDSL